MLGEKVESRGSSLDIDKSGTLKYHAGVSMVNTFVARNWNEAVALTRAVKGQSHIPIRHARVKNRP